MIKIDHLKAKDTAKRLVVLLGFLSIIICPYTLLHISIYFLVRKSGRLLRYFRYFCCSVIGICLIWLFYGDYGFKDFVLPYLEYLRYIILVDPVRMILAASYGLYLTFFGHFLNEGMPDWVVEERKKQLDTLIPPGSFNYDNRSHMLLLGTSGSGKGVTLNHIIKDCFETGKALIVISAKLASTDPYSQLAYCRQMAERTNRRLYIVSMDEEIADRCQYNPFLHLSKNEMINAIDKMIQTDSHFYSTNFKMWVLSIYKALKVSYSVVSMDNILDLYDYDDYADFIDAMHQDGRISDDQYNYLSSKRIKGYATTAFNDAANIQLICESCESVFKKTPNHCRITISRALEENAVIFFDLNGTSAAAAVSLLGSCILAEIQHVIKQYPDADHPKTVIADEASYYMTPLFVSCFNVSRSAGYQFIISTQGPSDFSDDNGNTSQMLSQIANNCNQYGFLRMNSPEDAQIAADLIGTAKIAETTHRADSIEYDPAGSIKPIDVYLANPNMIKNLNVREMIYCEKMNDDDHVPKPVMVKWRVDDL